jgi:hypothetical protein
VRRVADADAEFDPAGADKERLDFDVDDEVPAVVPPLVVERLLLPRLPPPLLPPPMRLRRGAAPPPAADEELDECMREDDPTD